MRRGRAVVAITGGVALGLLAGYLWAAGGLRPAPPGPSLQPGTWVEGERFRIKTRTAQVTTQEPGRPSFGQDSGQRYLVVTADVENVAEQPAHFGVLVQDAVTAHGRPGGTLTWKGSDAYSAQRPTSDVVLQPDLPQPVYLVWALPPDAAPPREVTLEIVDFVHREEFFTERKSWIEDNDNVLGFVTMPVRGGPA